MTPPEKIVEMTCQEYLDKYALRIKRIVKQTVDLLEKHGALAPFMQRLLAAYLLSAATGTPQKAVDALTESLIAADYYLLDMAGKLPQRESRNLRRRIAYLRTVRKNTEISDLWD